MDNIMIAATQNRGKLAELRSITGKYGIELISMAEAGLGDMDIEETGSSFKENSYIKASAVARLTQRPCIADDTGLCVDALGGAPGIMSARYAGVHGDDGANRSKLLAELNGVPEDGRTAHFACCITLCRPDGSCISAEGICPGRIAESESGSGGFGYDSIFVPDGFSESFAAMDAGTKNRISHRALALAKLDEMLKSSKPQGETGAAGL